MVVWFQGMNTPLPTITQAREVKRRWIQTHIRLSPALNEHLRTLAFQQRTSINKLVLKAVIEKYGEHE